MLSVNQMFYGTDEPVWLLDGSSPSPVKYHYVGSAHRERNERRTWDPRREYGDDYNNSPIADPRFDFITRREYSAARSRSVRPPHNYNYNAAPPPIAPVTYSSANPPPAPVVVPSETPISHTPVVPVVDPSSVPPNTPYTLLLKVPLCCEGCEKRVVKKLMKIPQVISVRCDIDNQRVTVRGTADTDDVLREAKKAFRKSRLW